MLYIEKLNIWIIIFMDWLSYTWMNNYLVKKKLVVQLDLRITNCSFSDSKWLMTLHVLEAFKLDHLYRISIYHKQKKNVFNKTKIHITIYTFIKRPGQSFKTLYLFHIFNIPINPICYLYLFIMIRGHTFFILILFI